jgi:hypothetical protein
LAQEIGNIENTIMAVAGIASINKCGPVRVPSNLLACPPTPREPAAYFTLKVIRAPGQKETIQEMLSDLVNPLGLGWRRELLYTRASWTKAEQVQYVAPDGTELRTMDEVEGCCKYNIFGNSGF